MTDLLKDLLDNYVDHTDMLYPGDGPVLQRAMEEVEACEAEMQKTLGGAFYRRYREADATLRGLDALAYFRAGFRLGGRLALEIRSSGPPDLRA